MLSNCRSLRILIRLHCSMPLMFMSWCTGQDIKADWGVISLVRLALGSMRGKNWWLSWLLLSSVMPFASMWNCNTMPPTWTIGLNCSRAIAKRFLARQGRRRRRLPCRWWRLGSKEVRTTRSIETGDLEVEGRARSRPSITQKARTKQSIPIQLNCVESLQSELYILWIAYCFGMDCSRS